MRSFVFLIAAAGCGFLGWHLYHDSVARATVAAAPKVENPVAVEATPVLRRSITERVELVGSLEPVSQVLVRSRVSGYLKQLSVDIGDRVDEGRLLIELDDPKAADLVVRAEAAAAVARAQLQAQRVRLEQARREVDRLRRLAEEGVSTEQEQEVAEAALSVAEAEEQLEQARLDQAGSDLRRARLVLDELKIVAPINGFVAERNVEVGDLAEPGDELLRIVDLSRVRTVVNVVERDYRRIEDGQSATVTVDAVPARRFIGRVIRKAPVLDPETRTARVIIEMDNPDLTLKPGMHARVSVEAGQHENVSVIPADAVLEQGGRLAVFAVDPATQTARRYDVTTGLRDGDFIEITRGLPADALVVTVGTQLIQEGSRLSVSQTATTVGFAASSHEAGTAVGE